MKDVRLEDDTAYLLELMAKECGMNPKGLLEHLVKQEDERRHIVWGRREKRFVRHRCGYEKCFETQPLPKDYAE